MEKNNGKIAIAIVAMFVVALSVVGFTYAYFVASVQGNTNENVTVTAGILEVSYKNTKTINAVSLVPGWQSDNLHYFDSAAYTVDEETGKMQYTSCVKGSETDNVKCDDAKASAASGLTEPAQFSVTNTDRNTAATSYVVLLNGITNTLSTAEQANFKYALCEGTCPAGEFASLTDDVVVSKGIVGKTGEVQVISGVQTLTDTKDGETVTKGTKSYQLKLYYIETSGEQSGMGATVSATIDIVGVSQGTDGAWYDANGVKILNS